MTQMGTDSLRFQFFSDATQTTLVKTTTITKSTQTPPAGYLKGWSFTVAYPDGESNTTQTWISAPGNIEKTRVILTVAKVPAIASMNCRHRACLAA